MELATALARVSILIVEDDPDTRDLYKVMLRNTGAAVRTASTAEAALLVLDTWRPDVVLCDLHLPGYDGYHLLEHVQANPAHCDIPMISISGSHPSIEQERSVRAGFAEHLVKPSKIHDIVAAVARVLATKSVPVAEAAAE